MSYLGVREYGWPRRAGDASSSYQSIFIKAVARLTAMSFVDDVGTEAFFAEMPELRGHRRFRIASRGGNLSQRPPLAITHQFVDAEDLPGEAFLVVLRRVGGAVESELPQR